MNKRQSNKMNAYRDILGALEKNRKTWLNIPALVNCVEEFSTFVHEIDTVSTRRASDTTGETAAKNEARKDLARHASKLAACGMAYAYDHADTELEAALDYSYSEIEHVKDADALQISRSIYKALNRDLPGLDEFLVSRDNLRELERLISKFNRAMVEKGAEKSRRVADTQALASGFSTCDKHLSRKLDRLMIRMKEEHPRFHNSYFNARKITDR